MKARLYAAYKLFIVIFIGIIMSHCATLSAYRTRGELNLNPSDFSKEIAKLEEIAKTSTDVSEKAKAYRQISMLLSHYKNPSPNYSRALKELETYISLDQEGGRADEIQNLLVLLRKIELFSKDNAKMKDENQKMKAMIENVKSLDIQMEQKRRKY